MLGRLTAVISLLLLAACSSGNVESADDATIPGEARDVTPEIDEVPDQRVADTLETFVETVADLAPDIPGLACDPGEGCFMDKCSENVDCQSGWCVEHMGEGVCTKGCTEECPPGWACKQIGASDPDLVYVCVSNHSNLCKPCSGANSCKAPGGGEDVCVDYGSEGFYCGGGCTADGDCPWGFSCLTTVTVDGLDSKQCVADGGTCPCTGKSIALSLWTPCAIDNEFGTCNGKRICTEDGLSDCDAQLPTVETCNGEDNDCDGEEDEPALVEGVYVPLCDDGNDCTGDSCSGEQGCVNEVLDEGSCDDADPCTVADHCVAGECTGSPVSCDDSNPCTDDSCDGTGGCHFENNSGGCDDDDPCTVGDLCSDGQCSGTNVPCDCQNDADCEALEDGDLCNGTLYCNLDQWPYECEVLVESVVTCPEPDPGPDAICLAAACDPSTGNCSLVPDHNGFPCDDGDACTLGDLCNQGTCSPGADRICNDGNPCTDDSCEPATGCVFAPNAADCNDDDVCTTEDTCSNGECSGGLALICDDTNICNGTESCDPGKGCQAGSPLACNDNNVCTGNESCHPANGCQAGEPLVCADSNPCTDDSCDPVAGCQFAANEADCDDGNECTLSDGCSDGICKAGSALFCNDDNICTSDTCDPVQGCLFVMNQAPCDDSDLCTTGDHCHLGTCIGAGTLTCADGNGCTDDSCQPELGCVFVDNTAPCDDGNECTGDDTCTDGACLGQAEVLCDDGNPCTLDYCLWDQGCQTYPMANMEACEQEGICLGECQDGSCLEIAEEVCDGVDNTCEGEIDEAFPDFNDDGQADCVDDDDDGDGSLDADDCKPLDAAIHPQAEEICGNNIDENCDNLDDPDTDQDGVCDDVDICPKGDDNVDDDNNGIPDACDTPDLCPGGDEDIDLNGDGIPDQCSLNVLVADGYSSDLLKEILESWGFTVTIVNGSTLGAGYDYSPYDIVAFMYDATLADPGHLASVNVTGQVGVVIHRGSAIVGPLGMGSGGWYQSETFSVTDNDHFITEVFEVGPLPQSYTYKSKLDGATANVRVLGTSPAPSLAVHKQYRRVFSSFYAHTSDMPWNNEAALLTWRTYIWAAGVGAQ